VLVDPQTNNNNSLTMLGGGPQNTNIPNTLLPSKLAPHSFTLGYILY